MSESPINACVEKYDDINIDDKLTDLQREIRIVGEQYIYYTVDVEGDPSEAADEGNEALEELNYILQELECIASSEQSTSPQKDSAKKGISDIISYKNGIDPYHIDDELTYLRSEIRHQGIKYLFNTVGVEGDPSDAADEGNEALSKLNGLSQKLDDILKNIERVASPANQMYSQKRSAKKAISDILSYKTGIDPLYDDPLYDDPAIGLANIRRDIPLLGMYYLSNTVNLDVNDADELFKAVAEGNKALLELNYFLKKIKRFASSEKSTSPLSPLKVSAARGISDIISYKNGIDPLINKTPSPILSISARSGGKTSTLDKVRNLKADVMEIRDKKLRLNLPVHVKEAYYEDLQELAEELQYHKRELILKKKIHEYEPETNELNDDKNALRICNHALVIIDKLVSRNNNITPSSRMITVSNNRRTRAHNRTRAQHRTRAKKFKGGKTRRKAKKR